MVARHLSERGCYHVLKVFVVDRAVGRPGIEKRFRHGAGENGVVRRECARRKNDEIFRTAAEAGEFVAGTQDIAGNGANQRHNDVLQRKRGEWQSAILMRLAAKND